MPINWLFQQPAFFVAWVVAVVITLSWHEFSHALTALWFGDSTAKDNGRLTLNPLVHIDILGFFMLLVAGFGWAKPVPVNPYNLKKPRLAMGVISFAGPLSNVLAMVIFGLIFKAVSPVLGPDNLLVNFLFMLALINLSLFIFNLIPIPPLDGSKVLFSLLPDKFDNFKYKFSINGPFILFGLILLDSVFNLGIFSALFNFVMSFLYKFF
ncbi:MAG: site-2 protease family protein [Patescibacteria group bacterium]